MMVSVSAEARELFRGALVCDMVRPWQAANADDVTLPRYHRAGIKLVSLTVGSDKAFDPSPMLAHLAQVLAQCRQHAAVLSLCGSVAEIEAAVASGRMALVLNCQGTNPIRKNLGLVEVFYRLGIRQMVLAYNQKNPVGDGCAERTDGGLSRFGIALIGEMNRVGMLVDGTHGGYRTTMEAMEVCAGPFIFSHSNAWGVHRHYRNIKDDQIRACAATGGLIGVNGVGWFLADPEAGPESMFRHVDYIANLVGPKHVGIGLDLVKNPQAFYDSMLGAPNEWPANDGEPPQPWKFVEPERLVELCELMLRKNYREDDVRGILGGNFLRVAGQVWK